MGSSKRTNNDFIEFFSEFHDSNFSLLNVFKNLLKLGQFDCILCVDNKLYPVHKVVLASCSPLFAVSEFLLHNVYLYYYYYFVKFHDLNMRGCLRWDFMVSILIHIQSSGFLNSEVCTQNPFHFYLNQDFYRHLEVLRFLC